MSATNPAAASQNARDTRWKASFAAMIVRPRASCAIRASTQKSRRRRSDYGETIAPTVPSRVERSHRHVPRVTLTRRMLPKFRNWFNWVGGYSLLALIGLLIVVVGTWGFI